MALWVGAAWASNYVVKGGNNTVYLRQWGARGRIYPLASNVNAPGGIDIKHYNINRGQMRFNSISWRGSLKGTNLTSVTSGTSINGIDPPINPFWSNMLNQYAPSSAVWAGILTSATSANMLPMTSDDTWLWPFQGWYQPYSFEMRKINEQDFIRTPGFFNINRLCGYIATFDSKQVLNLAI